MMKRLFTQLILIVALSISLPIFAENERHIHVNGEHLDYQNIQLLDQIAGNIVGDGYYWLNFQTGQWGYEGNDQIQGVLANIANQRAQQNGQNQQSSGQSDYAEEAGRYNDWEGVSGTGSVTSGKLNGQNCTFVSVGGTTMKSCD